MALYNAIYSPEEVNIHIVCEVICTSTPDEILELRKAYLEGELPTYIGNQYYQKLHSTSAYHLIASSLWKATLPKKLTRRNTKGLFPSSNLKNYALSWRMYCKPTYEKPSCIFNVKLIYKEVIVSIRAPEKRQRGL